MRISDLFHEASSALFANRARSLLTVLGIVIGIGAVIAMTALIGGATQSMMGSMGLDQARLIRIEAWSARGDLTDEDIEQIQMNVPGYELITGTSYYGASLSSDTKTLSDQTFVCAHPVFLRVSGIKMSAGRAFTDVEDEAASQVIVLSRDAALKLFGSEEAAVGQTVKLGNDGYTVVGVCAPLSSYDTQSYIPMTTAVRRIFGSSDWMGMSVIGIAESEDGIEDLVSRTQTFLTSYLGLTEDGEGGYSNGYVYVTANKEIIDEVQGVMATFQMLMVSVASISLLVGGIGIMNMMLTNVTERIREIGLRKALGARASDITRQFLLESVLICLVGGALGVLVGYGGAWGLARVAGSFFSDMLGAGEGFAPVISAQAVGLATGVCIAIGLVFGYYPARRAAKLNPVESLRFQ